MVPKYHGSSNSGGSPGATRTVPISKPQSRRGGLKWPEDQSPTPENWSVLRSQLRLFTLGLLKIQICTLGSPFFVGQLVTKVYSFQFHHLRIPFQNYLETRLQGGPVPSWFRQRNSRCQGARKTELTYLSRIAHRWVFLSTYFEQSFWIKRRLYPPRDFVAWWTLPGTNIPLHRPLKAGATSCWVITLTKQSNAKPHNVIIQPAYLNNPMSKSHSAISVPMAIAPNNSHQSLQPDLIV